MPILPRIVQVMVGPAGLPGLMWSEVYIKFSVEKSKGKTPNKAKVELYNLAPSSLAFLEAPSLVLRLFAGESVPSLLFQGDIGKRQIKTAWNAPDQVTTIECGDARKATREASFNRSYPAGTPHTLILTDLCATLALQGVVVGYVDPALVPVTYAGGFYACGKARNSLSQLCDDLGAEWSIQDGILNIVAEGSPLPGAAVVISALSGMRGSPERTDKGISVATKLCPQIGCGRIVSVVSKVVTGFYRVTKASHEGDSRGMSWETKLEAVPL
jgi:hypothetical protein